MKPEIAEDIEALISFAHSELDGTRSELLQVADRVEAYLATYQDNHVETRQQPKFHLMQQVRTLEGRVGHVTEYDKGRLNIKVTFDKTSIWYNEDELTAV